MRKRRSLPGFDPFSLGRHANMDEPRIIPGRTILSRAELEEAARKLPAGKSPGPDEIQNEVLAAVVK